MLGSVDVAAAVEDSSPIRHPELSDTWVELVVVVKERDFECAWSHLSIRLSVDLSINSRNDWHLIHLLQCFNASSVIKIEHVSIFFYFSYYANKVISDIADVFYLCASKWKVVLLQKIFARPGICTCERSSLICTVLLATPFSMFPCTLGNCILHKKQSFLVWKTRYQYTLT